LIRALRARESVAAKSFLSYQKFPFFRNLKKTSAPCRFMGVGQRKSGVEGRLQNAAGEGGDMGAA